MDDVEVIRVSPTHDFILKGTKLQNKDLRVDCSNHKFSKTIFKNALMTEIETETESFCRNPYNLTGICIWLSAVFSVVVCCYSEVLNLCMKSIERAHIPMNLWERIKLPRN
ncbi:hypothetical protein YC2023_060962 [Brassica napus]